jgi:hypothetical protein
VAGGGKHDAKEAANVADLVGQGKYLFYEFPLLDLRELRTLLSLKHKLKKTEQSYHVMKCAQEPARKKYGSGGDKIDYVHLKWAFSEATVIFLRGNEPVKKHLERLTKKQPQSLFRTLTGETAYYSNYLTIDSN